RCCRRARTVVRPAARDERSQQLLALGPRSIFRGGADFLHADDKGAIAIPLRERGGGVHDRLRSVHALRESPPRVHLPRSEAVLGPNVARAQAFRLNHAAARKGSCASMQNISCTVHFCCSAWLARWRHSLKHSSPFTTPSAFRSSNIAGCRSKRRSRIWTRNHSSCG